MELLPPTTVRLPADLKAELKRRASISHRTMSGEWCYLAEQCIRLTRKEIDLQTFAGLIEVQP